MKNSCNRAYERLKAKKILSQWWTCMLSFMAFNIIIILLFISTKFHRRGAPCVRPHSGLELIMESVSQLLSFGCKVILQLVRIETASRHTQRTSSYLVRLIDELYLSIG